MTGHRPPTTLEPRPPHAWGAEGGRKKDADAEGELPPVTTNCAPSSRCQGCRRHGKAAMPLTPRAGARKKNWQGRQRNKRRTGNDGNRHRGLAMNQRQRRTAAAAARRGSPAARRQRQAQGSFARLRACDRGAEGRLFWRPGAAGNHAAPSRRRPTRTEEQNTGQTTKGQTAKR